MSALYPTTTDKNTTECLKRDGTQGWINYDGYSDITFRPGIWYVMPVTRAQFVKMLARLQGADVSEYRSAGFEDVPADAWYAPYVNWAAANGIVYGISSTEFAPNADISRQDMAVMLDRYAQQSGIVLGTDNAAVTFTDEADIAAYALPAVQALQRAGVINGMPDNSFCPRNSATREQACAMLCRL